MWSQGGEMRRGRECVCVCVCSFKKYKEKIDLAATGHEPKMRLFCRKMESVL